MMKHKFALILFAVILSTLSMVGASSVMADSPSPSPAASVAPTPSPTPEAIPVNADNSVSLTGVPAVIDLGSAVPGSTASSDTINLTVYTVDPNGATLTVTVSNLAGPNGATLSANAMRWNVGSNAYEVVSAGTPVSIWTTDAATGSGGSVVAIVAQADVPWLASGNYTGTAIFAVGSR